MTANVIYTASDLDRKRREVTDAARQGLARIRDTDGMALVLLPARHYEVLEAVSRWYDRLETVERARGKPASDRAAYDFGDLTWLRHLDDDDLATFVTEVRTAVLVAYHDDDLGDLDRLVRAWRATAAQDGPERSTTRSAGPDGSTTSITTPTPVERTATASGRVHPKDQPLKPLSARHR